MSLTWQCHGTAFRGDRILALIVILIDFRVGFAEYRYGGAFERIEDGFWCRDSKRAPRRNSFECELGENDVRFAMGFLARTALLARFDRPETSTRRKNPAKEFCLSSKHFSAAGRGMGRGVRNSYRGGASRGVALGGGGELAMLSEELAGERPPGTSRAASNVGISNLVFLADSNSRANRVSSAVRFVMASGTKR
jgi:hypothetical protein